MAARDDRDSGKDREDFWERRKKRINKKRRSAR
jgi:hypothetical protein